MKLLISAIAGLSLVLLTACSQGVQIDEGSADIVFTGAQSVTKTDAGSLLISWAKAEGGGDEGIFAYNVYYRDYGPAGGEYASRIGVNPEQASDSTWTFSPDAELSPASSGKILSKLDAQASSYAIELALKSSHVYGFQVRAQNPDGAVDTNNTVIFVQVAKAIDYRGCIQAALNELNQVVLTFDNPSFANRVVIYRNGVEVHATETKDDVSFVDTSVVPGNSYDYSCSAQDQEGTLVAGNNKSTIQVPRKYTASEVPVCTAEGQIGCVTTAEFPSVNTGTLSARVVAGNIVAGVTGTAALTPISVCTTDGQKACVANDSFPAAERNGLENKIVAGYSAAGVTGSAQGKLPDCALDGEIGCSTTSAYRAAEMTQVVAPNIKSGITIAGVSGSYAGGAPATCASDGEVDCVANVNFRAALINGLPAKVIIGEAVAGIAGTAVPRLADCSVDGQTNCTANQSYKAADMTVAVATNIRDGVTLAGSVGGLTTSAPGACAADGEVNCVTTPTFRSALTTGLAAKVIQTNTVAGIAGTGLARLANCNIDGQVECTANNQFRAADMSVALAPNIKDTVTIAGITGSMTTAAPDNCTADGQLNCVTVPSFTAAATAGLAAKILLSNTVAGVNGIAIEKYPDCLADGQVLCSATNAFKAADMSRVTPGNVKSGVSIANVTGDYPSATYPLTGNTAATDLPGTWPPAAGTYEWFTSAGVAHVADVVSAGNKTPTTTSTNYVAANATLFRDLTVVGDASLVATNIKTGIDLFGVTGNFSGGTACSADGQADGCTTNSSFKAAAMASATAGNIKTGVTIAGVTGSFIGVNAAPTISITEPYGDDDAVMPGNAFTITFAATDADSSANIALYYSTSNTGCNNSLSGWTLITSTLTEGVHSAYQWTAPATEDSYYICARINDGVNAAVYAVSIGALAVGGYSASTCSDADDGFVSSDGGCKFDQLVWSNRSQSSMNWFEAVWDSNLSGNVQPDANDPPGKFDDYGNGSPASYQDQSTVNYCHDLVEGGYRDWRLPTRAELEAIAAAGASSHFNFSTNAEFWSANHFALSGSSSRNKYLVNLTSGTATYDDVTLDNDYPVVCVRPSTFHLGVSSGNQVYAGGRIRMPLTSSEDTGDTIALYYRSTAANCSGDPATNGWTLITNGLTDDGSTSSYEWSVSSGLAAGNYYICAQLQSATPQYAVSRYPITVVSAPTSGCAVDDATFTSTGGGCKIGTLVWSQKSPMLMTWGEAIWDSGLAGNAAADASDPVGRYNDYAGQGIPTDNRDDSLTNYCHELNEGSQTDWRMPTKAELQALQTAGAAANFNFGVNENFWSSTSLALTGTDTASKHYVNLSTGATSTSPVTEKYRVICVRDAP